MLLKLPHNHTQVFVPLVQSLFNSSIPRCTTLSNQGNYATLSSVLAPLLRLLSSLLSAASNQPDGGHELSACARRGLVSLLACVGPGVLPYPAVCRGYLQLVLVALLEEEGSQAMLAGAGRGGLLACLIFALGHTDETAAGTALAVVKLWAQQHLLAVLGQGAGPCWRLGEGETNQFLGGLLDMILQTGVAAKQLDAVADALLPLAVGPGRAAFQAYAQNLAQKQVAPETQREISRGFARALDAQEVESGVSACRGRVQEAQRLAFRANVRYLVSSVRPLLQVR